jgi:hypothetical protein
MTKATTEPTAMDRDPSVMAVQWKSSRRPGPYSTTPIPAASSNSTTSPTSGAFPTGAKSNHAWLSAGPYPSR